MPGPSEALKRMTTKELVMLLMASQDHKEDEWFRDAIVDEIKTRKDEVPHGVLEKSEQENCGPGDQA